MKIQILDSRLDSHMLKPAHSTDAGIDMYACLPNTISILPGESQAVPGGIKTAIPEGYVGLMIPRSSAGSKGLHLANVVGVIDAGYRGEILMKITNRSSEPLFINPMDRIAQLVVTPIYEYTNLEIVAELDNTSRGEGGFGSTNH